MKALELEASFGLLGEVSSIFIKWETILRQLICSHVL